MLPPAAVPVAAPPPPPPPVVTTTVGDCRELDRLSVRTVAFDATSLATFTAAVAFVVLSLLCSAPPAADQLIITAGWTLVYSWIFLLLLLIVESARKDWHGVKRYLILKHFTALCGKEADQEELSAHFFLLQKFTSTADISILPSFYVSLHCPATLHWNGLNTVNNHHWHNENQLTTVTISYSKLIVRCNLICTHRNICISFTLQSIGTDQTIKLVQMNADK